MIVTKQNNYVSAQNVIRYWKLQVTTSHTLSDNRSIDNNTPLYLKDFYDLGGSFNFISKWLHMLYEMSNLKKNPIMRYILLECVSFILLLECASFILFNLKKKLTHSSNKIKR